MPFLSTVRKLSSKSAIDTPIVSAIAVVDMSDRSAPAITVLFMFPPPLDVLPTWYAMPECAAAGGDQAAEAATDV